MPVSMSQPETFAYCERETTHDVSGHSCGAVMVDRWACAFGGAHMGSRNVLVCAPGHVFQFFWASSYPQMLQRARELGQTMLSHERAALEIDQCEPGKQ